MNIKIEKISNGWIVKYWLDIDYDKGWYCKNSKEAEEYIADKIKYFVRDDK